VKYLVIRHGKTDANRLTRAVFGKAGAPLNDEGQVQAKKLKSKLKSIGIDDTTPVAVSELLRTHETATYAGLKNITINPLLNEVNTSDPQRTLDLVAEGKLPQEAIKAAEAIINNPPKEKVWVTHGLVVAAIQELLGRSDNESFIPDYCEVRTVDIV
jgi:broad specificity phosphatase PhoE